MKTTYSNRHFFNPRLGLRRAPQDNFLALVFTAVMLVGVPSLWLNALNAAEPNPSMFQAYNLKHGITIKLPKHWRILESQLMKQMDTNTEVLTGIGQGNNDIVIAANYDDTSAGGAAATARVSVRTSQTTTQAQVVAMTQADLDIAGNQGYQSALAALSKSGHGGIQITPYRMTKENLSGYVAIRADYQEVGPARKSNTSIYTFFLGNRSIKVTLSYDEAKTSLLRPTIDEIKKSIQITK